VQTNSEPLLSQCDVQFRNHGGHDMRRFYIHDESVTDRPNKDCAQLHTDVSSRVQF
jgi:hypothetical protein